MKAFTLRIALLAFLGAMALSGCSGDFFDGGGVGSGQPSAGKPPCNPNGAVYCQEDSLTPRGTRH